jgi:hypothetical protein
MLSLKLPLTRRSDAAPAAAPLWHPNFRNFERLPDTKVVRTTFFITVASITLASVLLLWLGYREMQVHNLRAQVNEAQASIDRNQKQYNEAVRFSKQFAEEERKLAEAVAFTRAPILPSEFVLELARTLPHEVQIELVDMRLTDAGGNLLLLRGLVAGTKDQASGSASSYVDTLRTSARLAPVFDSVNLKALNPDPKTGYLVFEIEMKFKSGGKKP